MRRENPRWEYRRETSAYDESDYRSKFYKGKWEKAWIKDRIQYASDKKIELYESMWEGYIDKTEHMPKSLFKFFPFNHNSLKCIENNSVFMNNPSNFNDPFDCLLCANENEFLKYCLLDYLKETDAVGREILSQDELNKLEYSFCGNWEQYSGSIYNTFDSVVTHICYDPELRKERKGSDEISRKIYYDNEIDDFTNTYQDYVNSRYTKIEDKWIHTDQMVKTPYKEFSAENIEKWMKKKDTPDFTVWLGEKTDARILYAYTNIVNEVLGIEEAIWISSGIVKNNDFEKLIAEVNVYSEERSELLNVAEFHSYVETCGFYTPQEVCAVQSVKEANESINIGNEKNVIQVYKLVATCLSEHIENIEKTFYLPSRIARILTGITYGDGYEYINDNNEVVCKYSDVSKGENNQQECLQINSHILESSLKENDYRMFWVFRVYRSPSSKAYELYGNDITHDTDRSYIVWFDEEKSRYIELKEIEPVIAENNNDYVLKVKSLYDGLDD